MMKRRLFFFLEKLKISRRERRAMLTLLIILVSLACVNAIVISPEPLQQKKYAELNRHFRAQTAKMQRKNNQLLARYHDQKLQVAAADSVPEDTTKKHDDAQKKSRSGKELININAAKEKTLQELNGIGPTYAHRIVVYRQKNGPFKTKDELKKIKGIGKKRLAKIKPFIKLTASQ